jgi:hypothetical protein
MKDLKAGTIITCTQDNSPLFELLVDMISGEVLTPTNFKSLTSETPAVGDKLLCPCHGVAYTRRPHAAILEIHTSEGWE